MSSDGGVTVVIPVWDNYVQFLPDAVESVRRNEADASIVLVNNASSTAIPVLEGCELVRSPRRVTVGAARDLGLEQVATEYVVFLDADDMLLEGALDILYRQIAADPSVSISATSIFDEETGERHRAPRRFVPRLARWPRAFALADSVWSLLPIDGCAILRTAQVRESGGYPDAHLGDDWVLAVSLAWRGRVTVSDQLGRYYRCTEGSIAGRPWTRRELRKIARLVRERMRLDPAVPSWARAVLPGIAALQLVAIYLVRPLYRAARAFVGALRSHIR
jgi:glycosyltransferase involved in cell wall biosynthesis